MDNWRANCDNNNVRRVILNIIGFQDIDNTIQQETLMTFSEA